MAIRVLKKIFLGLDFYIIIPVVFLCMIGLIMVYSAGVGIEFFNTKGITAEGLFNQQKLSMIIGAILAFIAFRVPYDIFDKRIIKWGISIVSMGLLFIVLIIGEVTNGSKSWIDIGFRFQPSELSKLAIIVPLALFYSKRQHVINQGFRRYAMKPIIFIVLPTLALVGFQGDLGTIAIMGAIAFAMFLSSGYKINRILIVTVPLTFIGYWIVRFIGHQAVGIESHFRIARFANMINPFADLQDTGWQMANSYIAIASGGIQGKGLGESIQKFGYLPEPQTDFIFSIIAEELGFFGVFVLLLSFMILIGRILYIGMRSYDSFGTLICVGVSAMLMSHIILNIGAIVGVVPLTGVPLPFLSYGGTSLITMLIGIGMVLNVSRHVHSEKNRHLEVV